MRRRTWKNGIFGNTALEEARLNALEDDLGAALLQLARDPSQIITGAVVRDANGAEVSGSVLWPDGTMGVYSGTPSTSSPGAVSAYTITYAGERTLTIAQPAVTRNSDGTISNRPALTITEG